MSLIRCMTLFIKKRPKISRILVGAVSIAYPMVVYFYAHPTSILFLLYPVIANFVAAAIFAYTLFFPPSMIERFARLYEQLDQDGVNYTRVVTKVWVGFSFINGLISLATVIYGDRYLWMLYNGYFSYLSMGLLLVGEYLVRQVYKRKKKAER